MTTRSLEALVERQIKLWRLAQQSAQRAAPRPCVAFSRLPYSGGDEIARRVAELLGYGCFGREIVDDLRREHGVRESLIEDLDERVRNAIDRFVADAFRVRAFTESDYLEHVVRTVTTLGERGMAVIVGRGAPFILTPDKALRVLVIAPREDRIERLAKQKGIDREQAAREIAALDEERREFARHHFNVEPEDPYLYDLVLNTATWSVEAAARVVADALRTRFPGAELGVGAEL